MADELQIQKDLMEDLLARLGKREERQRDRNRSAGREHAGRGLAAGRADPAGRDRDRQGPARRRRTRISCSSALEIIIAIAASGHEEALIGATAWSRYLDTMQDSRNSAIREKVVEALELLQSEPEEMNAQVPEDDDYLP